MTEIPDPIAIRELEVRSPGGGEARRVVVRFGRPEPDPASGGDWRCPVQITGIGEDEVRYAFGVDPLQALQLALQMAGARLFAAQGRSGTITWLDMPELGFPEPPDE